MDEVERRTEIMEIEKVDEEPVGDGFRLQIEFLRS